MVMMALLAEVKICRCPLPRAAAMLVARPRRRYDRRGHGSGDVMGRLVNGAWVADGVATATTGEFVRPDTVFRNRIEQGGRFAPEPGRYRLYVSLACPWAHRAMIFRIIKGLEKIIELYVVHWLMDADGWSFAPARGVIADPEGARLLRDVYLRADPQYSGRVTVPVLWDTRHRTIVNNESADIIRIFNDGFDSIGALAGDYYPQALRGEIDAVNARVYAGLNNGVYRAGFATAQAAYDTAVTAVFDTLDWLEARLKTQPFLCGERLTEADWRLFTTLVRFDIAYHGHFKCNLRRLIDYPALLDHTRRLAAIPGVAATIDLDHIKRHYYLSHPWLDPTGIVPAGPTDPGWGQPAHVLAGAAQAD